jgi:hypothetical protein
MAANQVAIYNMAIGMVGGTRIMSLADDESGSVECAILNEVWATAVDDAIAGRDWSFARTVGKLNAVPDPLAGLGQNRACYQLPTDAATLREVDDNLDFASNPQYQWEIQGRVIIVDAAASSILWARYTKITRDVALFDGPFVACLVARLAAELVLPITNSKPNFELLWNLYAKRLQNSTTTNSMQGVRRPFKSGKLLRARNQ